MEDYHFGVECEVVDGKRLFRLNLSWDNIDFLLQDCPELGCVSGGYNDVILRLYSSSNGGLPEYFVAKPDGEYHAYIGVFLGLSVRDRSNEQIESELVNAINLSEKIPLLLFNRGLLGNINVGYALMRVV